LKKTSPAQIEGDEIPELLMGEDVFEEKDND